MPICPHCGATVPEGAVYCNNCGAAINSQAASVTASQMQVTSQGSTTSSSTSVSGDLQERLEKAVRRSELLGWVAAGLGAAILIILVVFYLL